MKLKNKRTGEIIEVNRLRTARMVNSVPEMLDYNSLAELNAEWEDVPEEPKEWWYIDIHGPHNVIKNDEYYQVVKEASKEIGNYFETKEEAELAVEKLKALRRLKDKGMRMYSFKKEKTGIDLDFYTLTILAPRDKDSLDLLFGGEE